MSNGPIENYTYSRWLFRPSTKLGYSAVGPGWTEILKSLDSLMVNAISNAVSNATVAREEFRAEGNSANAKIVVGQIKEKFGGLRVYIDSMEGLSERIQNEIHGAVQMAEYMCYKTCEQCGSTTKVETRIKEGAKSGWSLTLCGDCHAKRDNEV